MKSLFFSILMTICLSYFAVAEDSTKCRNGWIATQSGKYISAIKLYNDCIKEGMLTKETLARTYRNIGITYQKAGSRKKAIEAYTKAIEMNPVDIVNDYINRGNVYDEADMFKEAIDDYNKALEILPGYAQVFYDRGVTYEHNNMLDKAKKDFIRAYKYGLRTRLLYDRLIVHGLITPQKDFTNEQDHETKYKINHLNKFVETMLQKHRGKTLCPAPSSSIDSISLNILKQLGNDIYNKETKTIATTIWTLYPCPFSPFRSELKPASLEDIEGVWLFPENSQKLRFGPKSNQKSPLDPLPVKCSIIGYYPGGELRTLIMGGEDKCPFEKALDLDPTRKSPKVSSWSLAREGRISITRTDVENYIEEWDVYKVLSPFYYNDIQFKKGDLIEYLRKENDSTVNAATQFRHLIHLP